MFYRVRVFVKHLVKLANTFRTLWSVLFVYRTILGLMDVCLKALWFSNSVCGRFVRHCSGAAEEAAKWRFSLDRRVGARRIISAVWKWTPEGLAVLSNEFGRGGVTIWAELSEMALYNIWSVILGMSKTSKKLQCLIWYKECVQGATATRG